MASRLCRRRRRPNALSECWANTLGFGMNNHLQRFGISQHGLETSSSCWESRPPTAAGRLSSLTWMALRALVDGTPWSPRTAVRPHGFASLRAAANTSTSWLRRGGRRSVKKFCGQELTDRTQRVGCWVRASWRWPRLLRSSGATVPRAISGRPAGRLKTWKIPPRFRHGYLTGRIQLLKLYAWTLGMADSRT